MVNITLNLPDELKKELQKHDEVNWSAVMRRMLVEHLQKIEMIEKIASKSKLTEKDAREISDLVDKSVAKKLGLYAKK